MLRPASWTGRLVVLTDDELFDPYEQALLWTESDVGIVVTPDEQMHLLAISDRVVTDSVGHTTRSTH